MHKKKFNLKNLFWIIPAAIILIIGAIYLFNKNKINDEIDWMTMKQEQKLNVPLENQMPDLPNGCEVTSLSMLMNYYGIKVSKNELAETIQHVDSFTDGGKYRGNPHQGFVGHMTIANAGWCVYNEPLYNVARKYTSHIENITGSDFLSLIKLVSNGHPVMIITTTTFNKVNNMQTWDTNTGKVNVTPSSHACVITGYNKPKKVVYVNNPYGYKNQPVNWKNLQASYNQQGRQALYIR
ncbi:C39 family peptidase [Lactobacillus amylovorus]|uniref:C39 family peptidase n=1 Tax=Lactobacillus amylovorus TaxID=1604 RepID=A0A9X3W6I7_LACAM|nr:C39 family peptidase [Lactobacillus amylovorus]MDB6254781.1 C39 family peptidase [Lactobacillus amylovorus]MDB6256740.1 C39 family peptidase [Lactobacillus amylovorus]MDB6258787.1 C39 family peptidase [Lactobacillus amylovorus]MDB6260717.1 C39 family peptidase [Lactobacillus amylovorus]MDB6266934.1 C39 family peptidase [Lactobacillus amylovorus]